MNLGQDAIEGWQDSRPLVFEYISPVWLDKM